MSTCSICRLTYSDKERVKFHGDACQFCKPKDRAKEYRLLSVKKDKEGYQVENYAPEKITKSKRIRCRNVKITTA